MKKINIPLRGEMEILRIINALKLNIKYSCALIWWFENGIDQLYPGAQLFNQWA